MEYINFGIQVQDRNASDIRDFFRSIGANCSDMLWNAINDDSVYYVTDDNYVCCTSKSSLYKNIKVYTLNELKELELFVEDKVKLKTLSYEIY